MASILQTGLEVGDVLPGLNNLAFIETDNPRTGAQALRIKAIKGFFGTTDGKAWWANLAVSPGIPEPIVLYVDGDDAVDDAPRIQRLQLWWGETGPDTLLSTVRPVDIPPGGGYFLWDAGTILPTASTLYIELLSQVSGASGLGLGNWWVDDLLIGDPPALVRDDGMMAEPLMNYLVDEGFGSAGVDMGVGYQPDTTDRFIAFYDEAAPVIGESDAFNTDNSGVQVIVRSADYVDGRDTLQLIHKAIVAFSGDLGDGTVVTMITISQNPAWMGRDHRERHEFTAHYELRFQTTGDSFRAA